MFFSDNCLHLIFSTIKLFRQCGGVVTGHGLFNVGSQVADYLMCGYCHRLFNVGSQVTGHRIVKYVACKQVCYLLTLAVAVAVAVAAVALLPMCNCVY